MKKFLFLLICFPFAGSAQNLTGTWEGYGGGTDYIKMVLTHKGDSLFGYTYDEGGGYCKAIFSGKFDKKNKHLTGRGIKMLEGTSNHVLVSYSLYFAGFDQTDILREPPARSIIERLSGPRMILKRTTKKVDSPYPDKVPLTPPSRSPQITKKVPVKPAPSVTAKPPVKQNPVKPAPTTATVKPKTDTPKVTVDRPAAQKIEKPVSTPELKKKDERSSKLVKMIVTHADTLRLMVYDNGEVDGDTVTIFFNNRIVLNKFRITEKGKEVLLPLIANTDHTIELFANNLGTIPPNTALLIITDGKERHELRASYDLETNARIIIRSVPEK